LSHVFVRVPADIHELILVNEHSVDESVRVTAEQWPGVRVVVYARTEKGNALACGLINIRAAAGPTVTEVPSFEHPRINRVSNLSAFRDGLRVLHTIGYERRTARRPRLTPQDAITSAAQDVAISNSSHESA
jgi:hypothetical protein